MRSLLRIVLCVLFLPVLLLFGLLGIIFRRRDIVHLPPDHPEMEAAIARARGTYAEFLAVLGAAPAGTRDFTVKVRLPVEDGGHEHCWFNELLVADGGITGVLNNEPQDATTPKFGERIPIPADDVTDWGYFQGTVAEGFFTTRALVPHVKGKVRAKLLESMGWTDATVRAPGFAAEPAARDEARPETAAADTVSPVSGDARYQADVSKLTFRECRRFGKGWAKGCLYWVMTRAASPQGPAMRMPMLQAETAATRADLLPEVLARLDPPLAELQAGGYRLARYQQLPESFDGKSIARGGCYVLSADGRSVASVNFIHDPANPPESREVLALSLGAIFADGAALWITTMEAGFDPAPGSETFVCPRANFARLERELSRRLRRHTGRGVLTLDDAKLAAVLDRSELEVFRDRTVRRKLLVPAVAGDALPACGCAADGSSPATS